MLIAQTKDL